MILNISSTNHDIKVAMSEVIEQIETQSTSSVLTILFVSSKFDLKQVEDVLAKANLRGEILACTTSGELSGKEIGEKTVVGQVYFGDEFHAKTFIVEDLNDLTNEKNTLRFSNVDDYIRDTEQLSEDDDYPEPF